MSQQPKEPDIFNLEDEDPAGDSPDGTYVAPDEPLGAHAFGTTSEEARRGESVEDRDRHTEPEVGAPIDKSGIGSIVQTGDEDVDDIDDDAGMFGRVDLEEDDVSAEEAAMHTTDNP